MGSGGSGPGSTSSKPRNHASPLRSAATTRWRSCPPALGSLLPSPACYRATPSQGWSRCRCPTCHPGWWAWPGAPRAPPRSNGSSQPRHRSGWGVDPPARWSTGRRHFCDCLRLIDLWVCPLGCPGVLSTRVVSRMTSGPPTIVESCPSPSMDLHGGGGRDPLHRVRRPAQGQPGHRPTGRAPDPRRARREEQGRRAAPCSTCGASTRSSPPPHPTVQPGSTA